MTASQEGFKISGVCFQSCRSYSKPSWLQASISDLEKQMQTVDASLAEGDDSDTLASRAENYYRKRPQLLALLLDLYNRYLALADRYCQTGKQATIPAALTHSDAEDDATTITATNSYPDSDNESSLSFHFPYGTHSASPNETLLSELVAKAVENDILLHELQAIDRCRSEFTRKMELQESLLEVLESERAVLLTENGRLSCRVAAMGDENRALMAEAAVMKGRAVEMARRVLGMMEDRMVARRVEELALQVKDMKKRNRECCEELARRDEEKRAAEKELRFQVERLQIENARLKAEAAAAGSGEGGVESWKVSRWWGRIRSRRWELLPICSGGGGKVGGRSHF